MSQQSRPHCGAPDSIQQDKQKGGGNRKTPKTNRGHKKTALYKSLNCVMTSENTLKLNFTKAFKTFPLTRGQTIDYVVYTANKLS